MPINNRQNQDILHLWALRKLPWAAENRRPEKDSQQPSPCAEKRVTLSKTLELYKPIPPDWLYPERESLVLGSFCWYERRLPQKQSMYFRRTTLARDARQSALPPFWPMIAALKAQVIGTERRVSSWNKHFADGLG